MIDTDFDPLSLYDRPARLGEHEALTCSACGRRYTVTGGRVKELEG